MVNVLIYVEEMLNMPLMCHQSISVQGNRNLAQQRQRCMKVSNSEYYVTCYHAIKGNLAYTLRNLLGSKSAVGYRQQPDICLTDLIVSHSCISNYRYKTYLSFLVMLVSAIIRPNVKKCRNQHTENS